MQIISGTTQFRIEEPTAVAIGKFDGLHQGHRKLLNEIIAQKAVNVEEGDTPEILQRRVMEQAEWLILPVAVAKICRKIVKERHGRL